MLRKLGKNHSRKKRQLRVRKDIIGTTQRPRLNVFRSLHHIYAQVIDDIQGKTLVSASTLDKEIKSELKSCCNKDAAKIVGTAVAKLAVAKGIDTVVFDRAGYIYHGRIAAVADAARAGGLKF